MLNVRCIDYKGFNKELKEVMYNFTSLLCTLTLFPSIFMFIPLCRAESGNTFKYLLNGRQIFNDKKF